MTTENKHDEFTEEVIRLIKVALDNFPWKARAKEDNLDVYERIDQESKRLEF